MDFEILLRLALSVIWGGIVGAEREYRSKSAGFRTMILIAVGSCLFTQLSGIIGGTSNPDRIAANIITGIGFLGAGVIFKGTDSHINGVTTAATIWAVAAIGMALGAGVYWGAGCGALLLLIVLAVLPYVEHRIDRISQFRTYAIEFGAGSGFEAEFARKAQEAKLKIVYKTLSREGQTLTLRTELRGAASGHAVLTQFLISADGVLRFQS